MKKTLVYLAVIALIMTLTAVPAFAEEVACSECDCIECCCPSFPCLGDPRTQGYWKNHTDLWAARGDLPLDLNFEQWLTILNTPSSEGPWYQLAKQYISAWLNLNVEGYAEFLQEYEPGVGQDVFDALSAAETLLSGDPDDIDRQEALELAYFLDIFNNYDRAE